MFGVPERTLTSALSRRSKGGRNAFTLIEATACLVLLAVVIAVAAVNLRGHRREAGLEAAVVQLQQQDRLMRDRARRLGVAGAMVFDLQSGRVVRQERDGQHERNIPLEAFGQSAVVKDVRATHADWYDATAFVPCVTGRTASYAVLIEADGRQQWLLVAGLTGTFETVNDEPAVADIFARLSRDDAR